MNYLGFAAIGTVLMSCWGYIRNLFSQLRSYFIINIKVEGFLCRAVQLLLWREFKRRHIGDRDFEGRYFHVRPVGKQQLVGFEVIGHKLSVFWQGWKPVFISSNTKKPNANEPSSTTDAGQAQSLSISFIRHTFDAEQLLSKAVDLFNENVSEQQNRFKNSRYFVKKCLGDRMLRNKTEGGYGGSIKSNETPSIDVILESGAKILRWNKEDIGEPCLQNPFDFLYFPPEVLGHIEDIKRWKNSEKWFKEKSIPYRRGFLLHGVPGCGKTALVRAFGQLLDMPIFIYDLSTMTNSNLNQEWDHMLSNVPVIALFEDLDSVYHGRKNITGDDGVTFDCLLNCLSGIQNADGVFTIVTTNDITKIDPAMGNFSNNEISSRPGRLDKIIELKAMNKDCRTSMAKRILSDCLEEVDKLVEMSDGYTPAQFQELCTQVALKNYWKENQILDVHEENKQEDCLVEN